MDKKKKYSYGLKNASIDKINEMTGVDKNGRMTLKYPSRFNMNKIRTSHFSFDRSCFILNCMMFNCSVKCLPTTYAHLHRWKDGMNIRKRSLHVKQFRVVADK